MAASQHRLKKLTRVYRGIESRVRYDNPEENALLRGICENPHDLAPRFVYADWLREHGAESNADHLQEDLQRPFTPSHRHWSDGTRHLSLPKALVLSVENHDEYMGVLLENRLLGGLSSFAFPGVAAAFWSGFLAEVAVSWPKLRRMDAAVFERLPLRHVWLQGKRPGVRVRHAGRIYEFRNRTDAIRRLLLNDQSELVEMFEFSWVVDPHLAALAPDSIPQQVAQFCCGNRRKTFLFPDLYYESEFAALYDLSLATVDYCRVQIGLPPIAALTRKEEGAEAWLK